VEQTPDGNIIDVKTKYVDKDMHIGTYTIRAINNGISSSPETFTVNTDHSTKLLVAFDDAHSHVDQDGNMTDIDDYAIFNCNVVNPVGELD
jgi:hypothetical protein